MFVGGKQIKCTSNVDETGERGKESMRQKSENGHACVLDCKDASCM